MNIVVQLFLCSFGFTLELIFMLENKISNWQVSRRLHQAFLQDSSAAFSSRLASQLSVQLVCLG